jgi:hypothetical protein
VPKRRRNEDGSLVTPLSPRQIENLAKGRAALLAKASGGAGQGQSASADQPRKGPPATRAKASTGRRKVEVADLTKASGKRAKASTSKRAPAKRSTASSRSRGSSAAASSSKASGLERAIRWLTDV